MACGLILAGGLNGAGDTRKSPPQGCPECVARQDSSLLSLVVWLGFGAVSVWWTMNLSQLVQVLLISERYLSRKWLQD